MRDAPACHHHRAGSISRGFRARSTSQFTGHPVQLSSAEAEWASCPRSASSAAGSAKGAITGPVPPRGSQDRLQRRGRRGRLLPAQRAGAANGALREQPLAEAVDQVVDEQRPQRRLAVVGRVVPAGAQPARRPRAERVEEVALGVQRLARLAQHEPRSLRELAALGAREKRLLALRGGERALLQADDEERAHAPRAQRQGVADQHRVGLARRAPARRPRARAPPRPPPGPARASGQRAPARAARARRARLTQHGGRPGVEQRRLAPPRRREERLELTLDAFEQRRTPLARRLLEPVERVERPVRVLPALARDRKVTDPLSAQLALEAVDELAALDDAGDPQPADQIGRAAAQQCGAQQREQPAAERRVGEALAPRRRVRDAEEVEQRRQQRADRRGSTRQHRDLAGRAARGEQPRDLRGDQLGLGALVAALEQRDRVAGVGLPRRVLEQRALEVMQRLARRRLVVVGERRQLDHLLGERPQGFERRRAPGERDAPRLARQREHDRRADAPGERLDRVELDRVEVVEAVAEDGRAPPAIRREPQRIQRRRPAQLVVDAPEPLERATVAAVDARQLLRVARPRGRRPGAQARSAPVKRAGVTRRDSSSPTKECEHADEAGRLHGAGERVQLGARQGRGQQPLARVHADRRHARAGAPGDLAHQSAERLDAHAEHRALVRQLAPVVLHIGGARHDEDRPARERGTVAVEHDLCLRRVGGAGDERQTHSHQWWRGDPTTPAIWLFRSGACAAPWDGACAVPRVGACTHPKNPGNG